MGKKKMGGKGANFVETSSGSGAVVEKESGLTSRSEADGRRMSRADSKGVAGPAACEGFGCV